VVELGLPVGTRVSVYPLSRITFESSSGLLYPLDGLIMQSGEMIGTSNASNESQLKIVPQKDSPSEQSCYALILPSEHLNAMVGIFVPQVPAI